MAKDEEEDDVLPDKDAAKGFYAKYEPKEILGRGISSTVRRCVEKETSKEFAAKIIDLGAATETGDTNPYHMLEATRQEISILRQVMGHPYIIDLQDVFESDAFVFLVFELCPKGELFDYLTSVVTLSEKKTRTIMRQIFEGVEYIHSKNIVHRDLKPENILLDENHNVKITDFGFARQLKADEKLTDLCGTPGYLAPETLKCNMFEGSPGYSKEVDIWACGVIMFTLLVGCPPFWHRKQMVMLRNIMEGKYSFTSPEWADISEDPKDLIRKCLVVEPAQRITVKEVLKHPFFNQMLFEQNIDGLKRSLSTKSRRMSRINDIALVLCPTEPSTDGRTTYQLKSQNIRNTTMSTGNQLFYNKSNFNKKRTATSCSGYNNNYNNNNSQQQIAGNIDHINNNNNNMTNMYLSQQQANYSNYSINSNSINTPSTSKANKPTTTTTPTSTSDFVANTFYNYNNNYGQSMLHYQNTNGNTNIFAKTAGPNNTFQTTTTPTAITAINDKDSICNTAPARQGHHQQQQQQQQQLYDDQQQEEAPAIDLEQVPTKTTTKTLQFNDLKEQEEQENHKSQYAYMRNHYSPPQHHHHYHHHHPYLQQVVEQQQKPQHHHEHATIHPLSGVQFTTTTTTTNHSSQHTFSFNSIGTTTINSFALQHQQKQKEKHSTLASASALAAMPARPPPDDTFASLTNSLSHCCVESLNYYAQLRKQSRFNARKKFQFAILVIRAVIRIRRLRYTAEPLRVEEAIRDPYRVKVLRKVIDGCAFRVYGHWVKKGEGQNRAALFENTPRTELHALYINNLSR